VAISSLFHGELFCTPIGFNTLNTRCQKKETKTDGKMRVFSKHTHTLLVVKRVSAMMIEEGRALVVFGGGIFSSNDGIRTRNKHRRRGNAVTTNGVVGKGTPLRSNDDDEYYWTKRRKSSVFGMMNTRRRENIAPPNKSVVGVQQWDVICVRDDDDDDGVRGKYQFATVETRGKDGRIECVVLEKEVRDDLDEIEEDSSSSSIIFVETQETRVIREEDVVCVCSDFILFEQRMDQDRISNPHGEHSTNIWVAKKRDVEDERGQLSKLLLK
jgi:hypothetical protein